MGEKLSVLWPIEPHTEAKHVILRKYLDAWLPIISRYNEKIVYVDGFAGPGEYSDGQEGSPILAIKAVKEHILPLRAKIQMLFIEKLKDRCDFLKRKIETMEIPKNIKHEVVCGEFNDVISSILKEGKENRLHLAPSFVFIDPFGFGGIPLQTIKEIMKNPKCEVLITFMYEEINRFLSVGVSEKHLTATFGTEEWSNTPQDNPMTRLVFLHSLYKKQLESLGGANIRYVKSFKMKNKFNKADYFLFFGTNNLVGLEKMKEAMWKADKLGQFEFSDATYFPFQGVLFEKKPNYLQLKKTILEKYGGESISSKKLGNFIVEETSFLRSHYKTSILRKMEYSNPPEIEVSRRKKKGTYPDESIIKLIIK